MVKKLTSVGITPECREQLDRDVSVFNQAKLYAMIAAYQRGWSMLDPEQQIRAIRGDNGAPAVGTLCNRCGDIRLDANAIQREALKLDEMIDRAGDDGKIDTAEAKSIRDELRRIVAGVEKVAEDTRRAETVAA